MQIGTAYLFERGTRQMSGLSATAAKLQAQIATGKRIQTPSDDPVAAARVARLEQGDADDARYLDNLTLATSLLGQADRTLESVETQLQRARELAVRASNDTMNANDRAAIATELRAIVDDLFRLANTTDIRGGALFGGATTGDAFVRAADGTISYAGVGDAPPIPIAAQATVQTNDNGQRIFGNIPAGAGTTDLFAIVADLGAALEPGGAATPADLRAAMTAGIDGITKATEQVVTARASIGARAARLELETERVTRARGENEIDRGTLEGVDIQAAVLELQKTMTTLQATQASFARLTQLSVFDYLR